MDSLADLAADLVRGNVETYREGLNAGWHSQQRKIDAILLAYDRALADPNFKCPSFLMAALEAAR